MSSEFTQELIESEDDKKENGQLHYETGDVGKQKAFPKTKDLNLEMCMTQSPTHKSIKKRKKKSQRRIQETSDDEEILDIPLPFRSLGQSSCMTNLHDLFEQCAHPQPPLTHKQIKSLQLNEKNALTLTQQIRTMKSGMENLQGLIKKFSCTKKFKEDIDFIIENVGSAIAKAEQVKLLTNL